MSKTTTKIDTHITELEKQKVHIDYLTKAREAQLQELYALRAINKLALAHLTSIINGLKFSPLKFDARVTADILKTIASQLEPPPQTTRY
jgi:hypothetical protein